MLINWKTDLRFELTHIGTGFGGKSWVLVM